LLCPNPKGKQGDFGTLITRTEIPLLCPNPKGKQGDFGPLTLQGGKEGGNRRFCLMGEQLQLGSVILFDLTNFPLGYS